MALHWDKAASGSASSSSKGTRRITFVPFNRWIQETGASTTVYTHSKYNDDFGLFDQFVFQAVAKRAHAGAGTLQLTVYFEHSADGIHWMPKSAVPAIDTPLDLFGPTYPTLAVDDGSTPSLAFGRLAITLAAASGSISARVRITATGNDYREHEFAKLATDFQSDHDASDYYYLCYRPGWRFARDDFTLAQKAALFGFGFISHPNPPEIKFAQGVWCCFRQDGEFRLIKNNKILFQSVPK